MKTLFFSLLLGLLFLNTAQSQTMTGESGYPVSPNGSSFLVNLYIDLTGTPSDFSYSKITYDVGYDCDMIQACWPNNILPFVMYEKQGTRYPAVYFKDLPPRDTVEKDYVYLEARQKWWTFPNVVIDKPDRKVTNITFLVGRGEPISWRPNFNIMQLYFNFLKPNRFKNGDVITIKIRNIHLYPNPSDGGYKKIPDFDVRVKVGDDIVAGLDDESSQESEKAPLTGAIPAEGWESVPKVVDITGREVDIPVIYGPNSVHEFYTMDWSGLANGIYYLLIYPKKGPPKIQRFDVFRLK